jgi:hypothetical protein
MILCFPGFYFDFIIEHTSEKLQKDLPVRVISWNISWKIEEFSELRQSRQES